MSGVSVLIKETCKDPLLYCQVRTETEDHCLGIRKWILTHMTMLVSWSWIPSLQNCDRLSFDVH